MTDQFRRLILWIGAGLGLLAMGISVACGDNPPPPGPNPAPDAAPFTVGGTGNYQSKVFTLSGGSYQTSWQVQQTHMGSNVPCSIQADLWNEAGYYQGSVIWGDPGNTATSGPAEGGQVTDRMPPGNWYLEIQNSCSDSQSAVKVVRMGD
jgi:hypothetical protein